MSNNRLWIAQRHGQDWRDTESLAAIDWLTTTIPSDAWDRRLDHTRTIFAAARDRWAMGERVPLYDPADKIAWYIFQANAYAADRENWVELEAYRIAPVFRRLGQLLPDLRRVEGIEDRIARLMTGGRKVPDDGIYELLVAGAYARRGWPHVAFVPEQPGGSKTPDLDIGRGRSRWAIECKRVGPSDYGAVERSRADEIAAAAHAECKRAGASLDIKIAFTDELANVGNEYLADHVAAFLKGGEPGWSDEFGEGVILPIDWSEMRQVLRRDDVYFGSSRMIELLLGEYLPMLDYSVDGDWTPAEGRPFHATAMGRTSVVSWISVSEEAARRKARHFKSMVAGATGQLPGDRPGLIHVGYEATGGNSVNGRRHLLNLEQMKDFDPGTSRLQWVYGNYMAPEHTVDRNESAALSETTAIYPVRGRRRAEPLRNHMLFSDEDGLPGHHWHR